MSFRLPGTRPSSTPGSFRASKCRRSYRRKRRVRWVGCCKFGVSVWQTRETGVTARETSDVCHVPLLALPCLPLRLHSSVLVRDKLTKKADMLTSPLLSYVQYTLVSYPSTSAYVSFSA